MTTATSGSSSANEPSDSSASVTNHGEVPSCAFVFSVPSIPPKINPASIPPARRTACVIAVVVVFPCVPQIAMPRRPCMRRANISPRCSTVVPARRAAANSGLLRSIAELTTTIDASRTLSAVWPIATSTPSWLKRLTSGDAVESEPETAWPRSSSTRAIALMPIPPTPTK